MAATMKEMQALHAALAKSLTNRLTTDMEDNLPTDAATMGVVAKFLKDNNVSADPADKEDLTVMRQLLTEQEQRRKASRASSVSAAAQDILLN